MCFTSSRSLCRAFLELVVSPILLATLNTCVSTAIAGVSKATESITLAVLRPTPGMVMSESKSDGTWLS